MKNNKQMSIKGFFAKNGILIGFGIIVVLLSIFAKGFLSSGNLLTILRQVSCIGIATIGVGILIIMNCNDLAIGSMFALTGVMAGYMVSTSNAGLGLPAWVGFVVGVLTGVVVSSISGVIVAKGHINAFVVTLGMQSIARGCALIVAQGMPIGQFPEEFTYIGTENVFGLKFLPWIVIIYILVILIMTFVMEKLPLGRYIYAIGGNEAAARSSGIKVDEVKIKAYMIEGTLLGIAGTLMASRLKSAAPALGQGYEGDAIAGAVIGGVSFSGGIGKVWGMVIGALIIGVINNGMDLLGVDAFYKQIVKGSVIIIAVLIDRNRAGRG